MARAFISNKRYIFLVTVIVLLFIAVLGRIFYLHTYNYNKYSKILERIRQKFDVVQARRGTIVDTYGNVLATTRSSVTIGIDPQSMRIEDDAKMLKLAALLNLSINELKQLITVKNNFNTKIRWVKLADKVSTDVYEKIIRLNIKGVYGTYKYDRIYPSGSLGAHILGYINKEGQAVCGIERSMHFYLNGQNGWVESEKDGKRREAAQFRNRDIASNDGLHVQLTIDRFIQNIIEAQLKEIETTFKPTSASIIVSDPYTGNILALANLPTYNPNCFWEFELETQRNRAITDLYEPGSIFKIVPISAVLNEHLVDLEQIFDCAAPTATYKNKLLKLPKNDHPCGRLNLPGIVEHSSNRGVAQLGFLLGEQKLYQYAKDFGFGELTGYPEKCAEVSGILHTVKNWDGLTITRFPMGHAIAATPMQVHYAMATIANGGLLMKPQIIKSVFDDSGKTIIEFKPFAKRRVLSTEVAQTVSNLLVKAVGPRHKARIAGLSIAGKTGTSQILETQKGSTKMTYSHNHHIGSFSGFFPAESPKVVITVVVQKPTIKGTGYGNIVAAPAFKNIAQQLVHYLGISMQQM